MSVSITHSGRLGDVLAAAEKTIEAQHIALGKNKVAQAGQDLFTRFIKALRSALSDFPDDSDGALVLAGDAGENHFVIHNMQLSAGKPKAGVEPTPETPTQPSF